MAEDIALGFESMMAGETAPPLSLDEFRLFVANDIQARNALAFCEWYQRYSAVYFDHIDDECESEGSLSTEHLSHLHSCNSNKGNIVLGDLFNISASQHDFGSSSRGSSSSRKSKVMADKDASFYISSKVFGTVSMRRRHTIPVSSRDNVRDCDAQAQERLRRQTQSLLIVECWTRFLSEGSPETLADSIPQTEIMYVRERLPLNVTRIPRAMLCHGDMLMSEMPTMSTEHSRSTVEQVPKDELQQQHSYKSKGYQLSKQLRGVSSMPSLVSNSFGQKPTTKKLLLFNTTDKCASQRNNGMLSVRSQRLVSINKLQTLHRSLRPRPPLPLLLPSASATSQYAGLVICGYKPIPEPISKLIAPNSVPPAIFDTTIKVCIKYLTNGFFDQFYQQAHTNITRREQRNAAAFALIAAMVGLGVAAVLILTDVYFVWRIGAVPSLTLSMATLLLPVWMRLDIYRWWHCKRPTCLVYKSLPNRQFIEDGEMAVPPTGCSMAPDVGMQTIRMATGTWAPAVPALLSGSIFHTTCGKQNRFSFSSWLVRYLTRKVEIGDIWHIESESAYYHVKEPLIIRDQCHLVVQQLLILVVFVFAATVGLLLIP